jgi:hypothetical protein
VSDINVPTIVGAQEETFSQGCFFPDLQECKFGNTPAAPDGEIHSDGLGCVLDASTGFIFQNAGVGRGFISYSANEFIRALDLMRNTEGSGGHTVDHSRYYDATTHFENSISGWNLKQSNSVTKWGWETSQIYLVDGFGFALGSGGGATDYWTYYNGVSLFENLVSGSRIMQHAGITRFEYDAVGLGFFAAAPIAQPTVIGAKAGNVALANLCAALANLGLIVDNTT